MPNLSLNAKLDSLPAATAFLRAEAIVAGIDEESLDKLDLILEELFVNIALYAYPQHSPGIVEVTCSSPTKASLEVELADQGTPFNPLNAHPPLLAEQLEFRSPGDLGIYIVKQWTDSMAYRRDGDWNRLTFSFSSL
jgi:serine/threonine-protein kinase RsbW